MQAHLLGMLTGLALMGGWGVQAKTNPAPLSRPLLAFEENRGQTDSRVKFLARGDGYNLFLTSTDAVLSLRAPGSAPRTLRLGWEDARPAARISGREELPGRTHYLEGNDPRGWTRGVLSWRRVLYEDVYPRTDLLFYTRAGQLEYDFILAPGANPRRLRLSVEGADRLKVDDAGDLRISLGSREVRLRRPVAYQEAGGGRREIPARYRLRSGGRQVSFEVGAYDRQKTLVIDPVLVYSTYLGGNSDDAAYGVAADSAGNTYVTGETGSPDFPRTSGAPPAFVDYQVFVTKFDTAGGLVYSTIFGGGSGGDAGWGVAVDAAGQAVVTGPASFDFPQVGGLPGVTPSPSDAFVAKLAPDGASFVYSTLLGGSEGDAAWDVDVDALGFAYVTGITSSPDFPTVNALRPTLLGRSDAFVAKLSPNGSALVYSTYLGGDSDEQGWGIEVDPAGQAHVSGNTNSQTGFPVVNALYSTPPEPDSAFVTKLSPSGTSLVYSTFFFGGAGIPDIAIDPAGNAYLTGRTASSSLPVVNAAQPSPGGDTDAFVAKLSPLGSLLYSTYLGGSGSDIATAIDVDASGSAHVTGATSSTDFPLKDPLRSECSPIWFSNVCFPDVFVTRLSPQGSQITFSTYLGGSRSVQAGGYPPDEAGMGIAVDPLGDVHVAGWTYSGDFPVANAFQPSHGGGFAFSEIDAFALKISLNAPPDCSAAFASPAVIWPPNGKLVPVSVLGVTDPDGDPVSFTVTAIRQDEPLTRAGAPDATGIGAPAVSIRASRTGGGDGRVYRLVFEARDPEGAVCAGSVTVCVPHDRRPGAACGDGGPLFNSTGGGL